MNKSVKKSLSLLLILTTIVMTCASAFAAVPVSKNNANSAIQVMIDGKYVSFGSAAPRMINGRTMVPFRSILESLGATIEYNNDTREICAKLNDLSISFKANNADLAITSPTGTSKDKMDVAPYLDEKLGSTYVSARFIAQAFGYSVGWDNDEKSVVIIDFNKLFSSIDKDFSIVGKLFKNDLDMEKTYKTAVSLNMLLEMKDGNKTTKLPLALDMSALQKNMNLDAVMKMTLPIDTKSGKAESTAYKYDYKISLDENAIYMRSDLFKALDISTKSGQKVDDKTWIKMSMDDMNDIYKEMGIDIDFKQLMNASANMSTDELINLILKNADIDPDVETYTEISEALNTCKALFGDNAFTKKVSGSTTTYSLSPNKKLMNKFFADQLTGTDLDYKMVISEKNGKLADYEVSASAKNKEDKMDMSFSMTGTGYTKGAFHFNMTMGNEMKIAADMTCGITESNETLSSAPGKDEKVVSYKEIMDAMNASANTKIKD